MIIDFLINLSPSRLFREQYIHCEVGQRTHSIKNKEDHKFCLHTE